MIERAEEGQEDSRNKSTNSCNPCYLPLAWQVEMCFPLHNPATLHVARHLTEYWVVGLDSIPVMESKQQPNMERERLAVAQFLNIFYPSIHCCILRFLPSHHVHFLKKVERRLGCRACLQGRAHLWTWFAGSRQVARETSGRAIICMYLC